jgi:hypothetical protein
MDVFVRNAILNIYKQKQGLSQSHDRLDRWEEEGHEVVAAK